MIYLSGVPNAFVYWLIASVVVTVVTSAMSNAEHLKLKREGQLADPGGVTDFRSAWTKQEDEIILSSVSELGPKWGEIAARLPGRTEHAARNRHHRLTSRGSAGGGELGGSGP